MPSRMSFSRNMHHASAWDGLYGRLRMRVTCRCESFDWSQTLGTPGCDLLLAADRRYNAHAERNGVTEKSEHHWFAQTKQAWQRACASHVGSFDWHRSMRYEVGAFVGYTNNYCLHTVGLHCLTMCLEHKDLESIPVYTVAHLCTLCCQCRLMFNFDNMQTVVLRFLQTTDHE